MYKYIYLNAQTGSMYYLSTASEEPEAQKG